MWSLLCIGLSPDPDLDRLEELLAGLAGDRLLVPLLSPWSQGHLSPLGHLPSLAKALHWVDFLVCGLRPLEELLLPEKERLLGDPLPLVEFPPGDRFLPPEKDRFRYPSCAGIAKPLPAFRLRWFDMSVLCCSLVVFSICLSTDFISHS